MYLKVISCIFILVGFSTIGIYYSYKPIFRKNDLLEVKRALLCLSSEITFFSNINEAILNVEKILNMPIKNIFTKFRENLKIKRGEDLSYIWIDTLKNSYYETYLIKEDIENISIIGKIIGGLDINFNLDGINIVIDYIDSKVLELDKEKTKTFKMYQSLGILSGIMVIILLI